MGPQKLLRNKSTSTKSPDQLVVFHKKSFRAWWCADRKSDPGHVQARFVWLETLDGQVHAQDDAQAWKMHLQTAFVHLSNTTAKRRGIANMFLCQFKEIAELNDVEIIGVTLSTSANRKRGKSKLSSIEETWEDCCGFVPRGAKLACCQA